MAVKIGDFKRWEGNHIYVDCHGVKCYHRKKLLVEDLLGEYGPETALETLGKRLKCGKCGSRRTGFTIPYSAYTDGPPKC